MQCIGHKYSLCKKNTYLIVFFQKKKFEVTTTSI